MSSFKSKRKGHALHREEKIDLVFRMLCVMMSRDYPLEYADLWVAWNREAEESRKVVS